MCLKAAVIQLVATDVKLEQDDRQYEHHRQKRGNRAWAVVDHLGQGQHDRKYRRRRHHRQHPGGDKLDLIYGLNATGDEFLRTGRRQNQIQNDRQQTEQRRYESIPRAKWLHRGDDAGKAKV